MARSEAKEGLNKRPLARALRKHHKTEWLRRFDEVSGSLYLRIVHAMDEAIRSGELQPGDQIPPQRIVADILGVDFTTVTRAYSAARERGLVESTVGRGTFIAATPSVDTHAIKMWLNVPPRPQGLSLPRLMREATQIILARTDMSGLMGQQDASGSLGQRIAGAIWVEPTLGKVDPDRVLVCGGIQVAFGALLSTVMSAGDVMVVEPYTHMGMVQLARMQNIRVVACPTDQHGFQPEQLARICAETHAKAVFCIPTLHPITTVTMNIGRRRVIAEVCRSADVLIIEDDAYSRIPVDPSPAVATFAPERTYYITGLSKTLLDMRHGFLVAPDAEAAETIARTFQHFDIHPSPLTSAVVTRWIRDGGIEPMVAAVQVEAQQRRAIANAILPRATGPRDSYHVWLGLPADCDLPALALAARRENIVVSPPSRVEVRGFSHENGLRLALGGPTSQAELFQGLQALRSILPATNA